MLHPIIATGILLIAGTLTAWPADSLSNGVAVLDFTLEKPAAEVADWTAGLPDFVEMALQKEGVPTIERRQIRLILGERDLQTHFTASPEAWQLAKLPGVAYFVSGSVNRTALDHFALTMSVIQAGTATVKATMTKRGTYPADWLPAIQSLARDVSAQVRTQAPSQPARSEFEMMTWLPEAALPFFKGLEYYGRGDYASAAPWFRHSYEKDKHFDLARRWEARAYTKLNLSILAGTVSGAGTNDSRVPADLKRPVAAVVAGGGISAAGRGAFVQALARTDRFELFDPASIGATAREIDLQLTGQMAAPLDDRSVWLVVDDLIYLDAPDAETLVVRQQNLLSGEIQRQAEIRAAEADENSYAALLKAFLEGNSKPSAPNFGAGEAGQPDLPEPTRQDPPEVAFAKAIRLAAANPQSARLWIGLADFYADETRKMLLERAVSAIATNRQAPDAAFWLASALWREREMSRRIFYIPTATRLAPNPLTNDFARLLQWFPDSHEAKNLIEVTNHGEGSYVYTEIKDRRYLDSVFDYGSRRRPPPPPKLSKTETVIQASQPVRAVTDEERLARLNDYLKQNRPAPAWQLVNEMRTSDGSSVQPQVQTNCDALLQIIGRKTGGSMNSLTPLPPRNRNTRWNWAVNC